MNEITIIAATKVSKGGNGEYPVRYVVLKRPYGDVHEYSRHMQVFDGVHEDYFICGHYCSTYEDALEDMLRSMRENNEDYPEGNISHIPGLDFVK
jgi:hypothetical protein